MPWTFFDSSGRKLNTSSTSVADLDIDGATDIGADIVDADLFIIDDGAGGTNRKTAASRLKTYIGSAGVTREGGTSSEATSTATSATDLITINGNLEIAAIEPIQLIVNGRKTTGDGPKSSLGLKLNGTVVAEAATGTNNMWAPSNVDQVQSGTSFSVVGPRVTNYTGGGIGMSKSRANTSSIFHGLVEQIGGTANCPTVEITSVILRTISENSNVTSGSDEFQVYSMVAA